MKISDYLSASWCIDFFSTSRLPCWGVRVVMRRLRRPTSSFKGICWRQLLDVEWWDADTPALQEDLMRRGLPRRACGTWSPWRVKCDCETANVSDELPGSWKIISDKEKTYTDRNNIRSGEPGNGTKPMFPTKVSTAIQHKAIPSVHLPLISARNSTTLSKSAPSQSSPSLRNEMSLKKL